MDFDDYTDWIELHNSSTQSFTFDEIFITDDFSNPLKWKIPNGTVIDSEGYFYWFTNAIPPAEKFKCDILSQGCWIKTNEKAEIISKDIIKVNRYGVERYFCSEEHIQAVNKANPKPTYIRYSTMDYGYGTCTKDGWVR